MSPRVVIDSREKRPYVFENSVRTKIDAGDYSLEGLETRIAIERKSLDDLVQTLLHGRVRFAIELAKLKHYEFAAVVIEGSMQDVLAGNYTSKIKPLALLGIICDLQLRFSPVHFIFAGDRPHAYALVSELLGLAKERFKDE